MQKTRIEWVKNPNGTQGYTWNPITGCLNGCQYCYARKLANGRLRARYLANDNLTNIAQNGTSLNLTDQLTNNPFYPRFWPERVDKARLELWNAKPRGIFPVDMGELLGDWVPYGWQEEVFDLIKEFPQHRFYLLTKQPQNLIKFSTFPPNCYVGVSVTNNQQYQIAQNRLDDIRASVKFVSFEPLLDRINISPYDLKSLGGSIDWVIIGAQTKPYKPPKMKWIDDIVAACDRAGIPVFLKNNLQPLVDEVFKGAANYASPILTSDNKLRQEFPK